MSVFATGQTDCARSRMFVERPVFDRLSSGLSPPPARLWSGTRRARKPSSVPWCPFSQRASVEEYLADARKSGSRIACGGGRPHPTGFYLEPTVLLDVKRRTVAGRRKSSAPWWPLSHLMTRPPFREVNASPCTVSADPSGPMILRRALRVSRAVQSGVLSINCHNSVHVEAPFGGYKTSGLGRDLGMSALRATRNSRTCTWRE